MPYYENVFIARQDITGAQCEALAETFAGVIAEGGGKVTKTEPWGLRSLSYKIKKNRKGHYVLLNIDAPTEAVQEMERQMRLHEDVLRLLTLRIDELEEGPSAILTRQDRERGGRGRDRERGDRDRDRGDRDRDRGDKPPRAARAKDGDEAPSDTAADTASDTAPKAASEAAADAPAETPAETAVETPTEESGQ